MNEIYKEFLDIVDLPTKSHLLNIGDKETLEKYRLLRTEIENKLNDDKEMLETKDRQIQRYNEDLVTLKRFAEVILKHCYVGTDNINIHVVMDHGENDYDKLLKVALKYAEKKLFD